MGSVGTDILIPPNPNLSRFRESGVKKIINQKTFSRENKVNKITTKMAGIRLKK